ncbi:TfdA family taurine dioxygenase [Durotheca rogersii]|uniref:TfdA family taurine dioxygenase n=1 Tax=Durotheca rogersii TaxID=419775 RepID=UPI0022210159|nr:TfdA family taurine dioxygenase [Durotheca rogersii]KAI5861965.1 TfdA family taurine dioxygenase [Durotheca rogersii]
MGSLGASRLIREPLKRGTSLDHLEYVDMTPIIGREYPTAKLKAMLEAPNADEQLRDLAILISERGVVVFRAPQDDLTIDDQKHITDQLGRLTGRPAEHGLHVHPLYNDPNNIPMADGTTDEHIYVINSEAAKKLYATMKDRPGAADEPRDLGREWHSDSLYENAPSDFSFLRMESTPATGGDTLWASGYELYDRLSGPFRRFLETLTATCAQPVFATACAAGGYAVASPRGSPLNVGAAFAPSHPVVRTNPVTGWKSVFAGLGLHVSRIDGVTSYEDALIRDYLLRLLTRNHDGVARLHWTRGACAIWTNVSTLHAATPDTHLVDGIRTGVRASGIGEVPYLDPASTGRREALGLPQY